MGLKTDCSDGLATCGLQINYSNPYFQSNLLTTHYLRFCIFLYSTTVIQKVSYVCECCHSSTAVAMVRMRAEFFDSLSRHGRNMQTFERRLHIVLCVYTV
jgi:hypothetical protein